MTTEEINNDFIKIVDVWEKALDNYTDNLFALRPDEESWSIGQVCEHLIESTKRIFVVIEKCTLGNRNSDGIKTEAGEKAFRTNILSETKVKMPVRIQKSPQQPESKLYVRKEFEKMKTSFAFLANKVSENKYTGKEQHPILGYLNAIEWLQMLEMHFRHHLKQKENIDAFLKSHVAK